MSDAHKIVLNKSNREISISVDSLRSFENNQVRSDIAYSKLDNDLWQRKRGKLAKKDYKTYEKTINQFFVEFYKVENQQDRRKKDIVFGELHNSDASPIKREDNRGNVPSELTIAFRMIVLSVLKNKDITNENLTLFNWLKEFYIINDTLYSDYKKDRNNLNGHALLKNIDTNQFSFNIETLSTKEKQSMIKQYYYNVVEFLKNKLNVALRKLESDGMIHIQNYMVGTKINKNDKTQNTCSHILTPQEVSKLKELEIAIKDELNLHHLVGKRLYYHDGFKKELNNRLSKDGLKTTNSHNYYEYVYNTYTINKIFTDEQLTNYINKNTYIKETLSQEKEEFIHNFRKLVSKAVCQKYDRASEKYKTKIEVEIRADAIGEVSSLIEGKQSIIDTYNKQNKCFTKVLLNTKHGDNLPKLFDINIKKESQILNDIKTYTNSALINKNDLPF